MIKYSIFTFLLKILDSINNLVFLYFYGYSKRCHFNSSELIWNPIHVTETGDLSRNYLHLTYAESSYMELPDAWQKRMDIWDEVMNDLQKTRKM